MYLIVNEDGSMSQQPTEPEQELLAGIDNGECNIFRFHNGKFEVAAVEEKENEEDEDEKQYDLVWVVLQ